MPTNKSELLARLELNAQNQKKVNKVAADIKATRLSQEPDIIRNAAEVAPRGSSPVGKA
jgi:hypothetical protein